MKNCLNTDIIYQGMTFHVQTEDMGVKRGYLQTQIYYRGKILNSVRVYYNDLISREDFSQALEQRLESEHQKAIEQAENGHLNIKDLDPILTPADHSDKKSGKIKIIAEASRFLKQRSKPKSVFETSPDSAFVFNHFNTMKVNQRFRSWRIPVIVSLSAFLFISLIALPKSKNIPSKEETFSQCLVRGEELVRNGDFEQAEKVLNQAISLFPNRSQAYVLRSRLYAKQGSTAQSIDDLSHAADIEPANGATLYELGTRYFEANHHTEAIDCFKKAILTDYRTQEIYLALGTALYRSGDIQEAEGTWRETLKINPKNPEAHYHLGVAALTKESYGEAILDLQAAIDNAPEMTEAYLFLGDAYYQSGLKDKAGKFWEKALALEPDNVTAKIKLKNLQ
jgi:tetratricopeptide (TPR) repeat protein